MVYPLEAIAPSVEPDRQAWSLAQRIVFRFAGVYLVLYLSDGWLQLLPVGGEESMKRYLTRTDGTPYVPIPTPQQQAQARRGGYCLAEAVVPGS